LVSVDLLCFGVFPAVEKASGQVVRRFIGTRMLPSEDPYFHIKNFAIQPSRFNTPPFLLRDAIRQIVRAQQSVRMLCSEDAPVQSKHFLQELLRFRILLPALHQAHGQVL
jgi:hypothetical protein